MFDFYSIDFRKIGAMLLPTRLRANKMLSWVKVLLTPVNTLHYFFLQKRKTDLYKIGHNGQVCYLRKALNDAFDRDLRRIVINDGNRYTQEYIYTYPESKPKYLGNIFLYDDSVFEDTGADFIVLIPNEVWEAQKTQVSIGEYRFYQIEAILNFYKLASKRYKIQKL